MRLACILAGVLAAGAVPATACTTVGFGAFKVGQRVGPAQLRGLAGSCSGGECTYNSRAGIEYVAIDGIVREVSAPVRIVRSLPSPARMDAAYARRASRGRCLPFRLKRDNSGAAFLETAERIDRASGQPVRTSIYRDERGTAIVAISSLPSS